jgi:hypothetical protein
MAKFFCVAFLTTDLEADSREEAWKLAEKLPRTAWDDFNLEEVELSDDEEDGDEPEPPEDNFRDDVEADADAMASAGLGTDEDYGGGCEQL